MEDTELINQALVGKQTAYDILYEKYKGKLMGFALKGLSNKSDAEELVQRTFIKAFLKLNTIKDKEKFKSWLFTIFKKNEIDFFRSKRYTEDITKIELKKFDDLELGLDQKELPDFAVDRLQEFGYNIDTFEGFETLLLHKIGVKCQTLIRLKHLEKISYKEIATTFFLENTEKQLKDQLYECMKKAKRNFN